MSISTRVRRWGASPAGIETLVIVAFVIWVAWPLLDPRTYEASYDAVTYSGPNLAATFRAWAAHRWPIWDDSLFGGTAFAGNLQTATFNPLKLVFAPFGVMQALDGITIANLLILAFGTRAVARRSLCLGPGAGAVAAVVVTGGGVVMVRTMQFEQIAVIAWIPWALVAIESVIAAPRRRRARPVGACAAALAMLVLAGHPNQTFLAVPLLVAWTIARLVERRPRASSDPDPHAAPETARSPETPETPGPRRRESRRGRGRLRWPAIGGLLLAGLLAAAVLALPLLLVRPLLAGFAPGSAANRDTALLQASAPDYVAHADRAVTTLLGDPAAADATATAGNLEGLGFVGITAVVLAAAGLSAARSGRLGPAGITTTALAGIGALGLLLALGPRCAGGGQACAPIGSVYRLAARTVPGFSLARVPGRWLVVTTFAIALLAAVGVDSLGRPSVAGRRERATFAGVLVAATAAAVLSRPILTDISIVTILAWMVFAVATIACVLVAGSGVTPRAAGSPTGSPAGRSARARRLIAIAAVVPVFLVVIELGAAQRSSPTRTTTSATPLDDLAGPVATFLARSRDRYLTVADAPLDDPRYLTAAGAPNSNLLVGARSIDGYDGGLWLSPPWVVTARALSEDDRFEASSPIGWHARLPLDGGELARFGVHYVVVDPTRTAEHALGRSPTQAEIDGERHRVVPGWGEPLARDHTLEVYANPRYRGDAVLYHRWHEVGGTSPDSVELVDALRSSALSTAVVTTPPALSEAEACPSAGTGSEPPNPSARDADPTCPADPVEVQRPRPGLIEVATASPRSGLLVVDEQPLEGWEATVDGEPTVLTAADGSGIGVPLRSGTHHVQLHYRAPGQALGLALSGGGLLTIAALWLAPFWSVRPRRRFGEVQLGRGGDSGSCQPP